MLLYTILVLSMVFLIIYELFFVCKKFNLKKFKCKHKWYCKDMIDKYEIRNLKITGTLFVLQCRHCGKNFKHHTY